MQQVFCYSYRLVSLQFLSANKNKLRSIPDEICHLTTLTEIHLADNYIERYSLIHSMRHFFAGILVSIHFRPRIYT